jgi:hypothetical protein
MKKRKKTKKEGNVYYLVRVGSWESEERKGRRREVKEQNFDFFS